MDLKQKKKERIEKAKPEDFIKVTEKNRQFAIKIGVIVYVIDDKKIKHKVIIRPRLHKGFTLIADGDPHFKEVNIVNGESEEEYVANFKPMLDMFISQGRAFIKKDEKPITYKYI